jgi:hypothetical protein
VYSGDYEEVRVNPLAKKIIRYLYGRIQAENQKILACGEVVFGCSSSLSPSEKEEARFETVLVVNPAVIHSIIASYSGPPLSSQLPWSQVREIYGGVQTYFVDGAVRDTEYMTRKEAVLRYTQHFVDLLSS